MIICLIPVPLVLWRDERSDHNHCRIQAIIGLAVARFANSVFDFSGIVLDVRLYVEVAKSCNFHALCKGAGERAPLVRKSFFDRCPHLYRVDAIPNPHNQARGCAEVRQYEVRLPGGNRVFFTGTMSEAAGYDRNRLSGPGAGKSVCARRARRAQMIKRKPLVF